MATTHSHLTEAEIRGVAGELLEAWNRHDIETILEHLHPDIVWVEPSLEGPARGKEAVRASLKNSFTAFPDFHLPAEDFEVFADAKMQSGVVTWSLSATMTGPLDTGVPATGRPVRISGANLVRFRDGLISEHTNYYDALDMMQQMGLLPRTNGLGFKALVLADVMAGKAMKVLQRH